MELSSQPKGRIGRYKVIDRIAIGGMAEVLLAIDELGAGAQRTVVVKKILPHLAEDEQLVQMFTQEAKIASGISHPNVVRIHKLGKQNGYPYLVMEHVQGCTFRTLMRAVKRRNVPFPIGVALQLAIQAAAGAHAAHEYVNPWGTPQEVVHRDLTPHNLMVTAEGTVKVVDFGIAKPTLSSDSTKTGIMKGKMGYLSPEQVLQRHVDRRSDIFTLCIVIWEMIATAKLFDGKNDLAILQDITQGKIRPMMDLRPETPRNLIQVIERGLNVDPDQRYPTAADLAAALKRAAHESNILLSPRETAVFVNSIIGDKIQDDQRELENTIQKSVDSADNEIMEMPSFSQHSVSSGIEMSSISLADITSSNTPKPVLENHLIQPRPTPTTSLSHQNQMLMVFLASLVMALIGLGILKYNSQTNQEAPPVPASTTP